MKQYLPLSFILFFTILTVKAQSPISLSSSNMPSGGDTLRYSNALQTSLGSYTQTGTNFSWNFSTLEPISQGIRNFKNALQTPYAFYFLGFNEYGEKVADTLGAGPLTMTNYYLYYKKQTSPINAYIADGSGITFSSIPVPNYYTDKDELYVFPLTYPDYDSTSFKFSTASSTLIPIKYSKTGYRVTKCDGWGSITTPYGTSPCIRIITTQYSQDSIKNNLIPIPLGFPNNQRSYQWLTTGSKIPFLEVNGNLVGNNFTITQIRYRDIARVITSVNEGNMIGNDVLIYPNPASEKINWHMDNAQYRSLELFNAEGKLIRSQGLEGNNHMDVKDLEKGLYFLKFNGEKENTLLKFIKD